MLSSLQPPLERAVALFGAFVRLRVEDMSAMAGFEATSAAVRGMAQVHRLMSFHETSSELSRLNREAWIGPVQVSSHTLLVLTEALRIAAASDGIFDPTIAPLAVRAGFLPRPPGAREADPSATWRDVHLDPARGTVRFGRPLWIDLGGVAKGYGVDLATEILREYGAVQGSVNAGGDLRVFGPRSETVALDDGVSGRRDVHGVSVRDCSLASSGSLSPPRDQVRGRMAHFDGVRRRRSSRRFVSVLADRCVHADALTKVVMARGAASASLLRNFGASATVCAGPLNWKIYGAAR